MEFRVEFGGIPWNSWDILEYFCKFMWIHMDVGTFWMYFFVYIGAFWWEYQVFWWNFVMFDGLLGDLGIFWDVLVWLCRDLVAFVLGCFFFFCYFDGILRTFSLFLWNFRTIIMEFWAVLMEFSRILWTVIPCWWIPTPYHCSCSSDFSLYLWFTTENG